MCQAEATRGGYQASRATCIRSTGIAVTLVQAEEPTF
jgi:hypothetical protein